MRKSVSLLFVSFFLMASCLVIAEPALSSDETKENFWTAQAPVPEAGGGEAAVVNGKIYVIGGDANFEYNPDTDTWTTKKPMPTPRSHFGIAIYQNKIYTMGDYVNSSDNEVYDPATDTWAIKKSLPANGNRINSIKMASVINGKIHLVSPRTHDIYDVATDTWTTGKIMPFPLSGASVAFDDKIYVIVGNKTQIYDPDSGSWSLGVSSPISVGMAAVCATTGVVAPKRIYVFGGSTGFVEETNVTQVYDPETDTWTLGASMPTTRAAAAVAVVNDLIYVIGGGFGWGMTTNANEQYTPFGYGLIEPVVSVLSPQNKTCNENSVPLTFTVDKPVSWIQYSLDGQDNLTVTENTTLTDLPNGLHKITVYAKYAKGSIGASETTMFTVEVFPTTLTAVIIISISTVVASVALLFHFKKRKNNTADEL